MTPEQKASVNVDALLQQVGWHVCDMARANIHVARGVALRELPLNTGYGFADYLLYIDGNAAGVIEANKEGHTLTGVEVQAETQAELNLLRAEQLCSSLLSKHSLPLPNTHDSDTRVCRAQFD